MILDHVLDYLQLNSLKELVIQVALACNGNVETRTELVTSFVSKYEVLSITSQPLPPSALRQRTLKLVHYTTSLRQVMSVTEVVIQ